MSMKRCVMRVNSSACVSSSTSNGGVNAEFNTVAVVAISSTSPVANAGFSAPAMRLEILPLICTTHSDRIRSASMCESGETSGLNTTCRMPVRSRKSMKTKLPWSRRRCTHPATVTSRPMSEERGAPQSVSLYMSQVPASRLSTVSHFNRSASGSLHDSRIGSTNPM